MSAANKALITRWFEEVWNKKREAAIEEMLAPSVLIYGIAGDLDQALRSPEEFKVFHRKFLSAFPNLNVVVEETVAEGDKVVARCTVTGTHSGTGLGKATNKTVAFTGICLAKVKDGKLVAGWNNFDFLALYQQIGLVQMPSV